MTTPLEKYLKAIPKAPAKFELGVNPPPEDWQDEARDHLDQVANRWRILTVFANFVREALANDDYQEYLEAILWLQAEESEPDAP